MQFANDGKAYSYTTAVRHQGVVIALAMGPDRRIVYRCLALNPAQPDDDKSWSGLRALPFPEEIRPAGMSLVTVGQKTAERTADAPFQALSDGRHLYLFRQSLDKSILVDRFVFEAAQLELKLNWESRYQRSRKRDLPANRKDTLGPRDMEGRPFIEPTLELTQCGPVQKGRFAVLLLPTGTPDRMRWQIFVAPGDGSSGTRAHIDSFSILRSEDGLFDLGDLVKTAYPLDCEEEGKLWVSSPPAALAFAQQELVPDNYGREQRLKREARVMLAFACGFAGNEPGAAQPALAVLDFALRRDGGLAPVSMGGGASQSVTLAALNADDSGAPLAMPLLSDPSGAQTVYGARLALAPAASAPFLLDSADGNVHVYFRDADGAFSVVQYATLVSRARYVAKTKVQPGQADGPELRMVARSPGSRRAGATISVAGDGDGACKVTISSGAAQEVWPRVPRRAEQLVAVLNGEAATDERDLAVIEGRQVYYDYSAVTRTATPRPEGDAPALGSALFAASLADLPQDGKVVSVADGTLTADSASPALDCRWMPSPGTGALQLDGADDYVALPTGKSGVSGSMAMEAWVRPEVGPSPLARIVTHHAAADQRYTLGLEKVYVPQEGQQQHSGMEGASALWFDGVDDYIVLDKAELDAEEGLTFEVWVMPHSIYNHHTIIGRYERRENEGSVFELDVSLRIVNGYYQVGAYTSWPREGEVDGFARIPVPVDDVGQWVHLAGVLQGRQWTLYRNGETPATFKFNENQSVRSFPGMAAAWTIGAQTGGSRRHFRGAIREVRIWTASLTQDQIRERMRANLSGRESNLYGLWLLDGSGGDKVANRNTNVKADGTLGGTAGASAKPTVLQPPLVRYSPFAGVQQGKGDVAAKAANLLVPGAWRHLAAVYEASTALSLDGEGYAEIDGDDTIHGLDEALTAEAWVSTQRGANQVVAAKWGAESSTGDQSWKLALDAGIPSFSARIDDETAFTVTGKSSVADGQPHHLAAVYDVTPQKEYALYLPGKDLQVKIPHDDAFNFDAGDDLTIELWVRVAAKQVDETEGHNYILSKYSGDNSYNNAPFEIFFNNKGSTVPGTIGISRVVPSGDCHITSKRRIDDGRLHHIALVQSSRQITLYIDGAAEGTVENTITSTMKNSGALNVGQRVGGIARFTGLINDLRMWRVARTAAQIADNRYSLDDKTGLVGHWPMNSANFQNLATVGPTASIEGTPSSVAIDKGRYELRLLVDGATVASEPVNREDTGWKVTLESWNSSSGEQSYYLHATSGATPLKKGDRLLLDDEVVELMSDLDSTWGTHPIKVRRDQLDPQTHGLGTRVSRLQAYPLQRTRTALTIGRTADGAAAFQGTIDELRLWGVGRSETQVAATMSEALRGDAKGLVGYWRFEEGKGTLALDSKGENHARLRHPSKDKLAAMWSTSSFRAKLSLLVDGQTAASPAAYDLAKRSGYGDQGAFTIGALRGGGKTQQPFKGLIDELRIWDTARTAENLRDNMFRALAAAGSAGGVEPGLAGYWPCDGLVTVKVDGQDAQRLPDSAGLGQAGTLYGATLVSEAAPVSDEAPVVRHAYRGVARPDFNRPIAAAPAAAEYGDMQWDVDGQLTGVIKRCYFFADAARGAALVSGYKVGDLELHFIGQVQTAPTLVGYIEGAPPVPSENMTVNYSGGDDYAGASSVEVIESSEALQVYSASRDTGFDMSVDVKAGLYLRTEVSTLTGPIPVLKSLLEADSKIGAHAVFEHSQSWLSSANLSVGRARTLTKSLALSGSWEELADYDQSGASRYLNPQVGRRYVPNNVGYALVKSGTADLFALRLRQTGALVSYQLQANPDIPEDWNIIMFPLNPRYVKNGTLDGMVGLVDDPDYPGASLGERGSYFKPLEAYALKEKIDRESGEIAGYYEKFDAGGRGRSVGTEATGASLNADDANLGFNWNELASDTRSRLTRSLANTYVWTAEGGFYAEEEQFTSVMQESLGGAYSFLGKGGIYADMAFTVGEAGVFAEADLLFGGHINVTSTQSSQQRASFGLSVQVKGEGFLRRWVPEQGKYAADLCPGKVDAYRFMTFHLAPSSDHFETFFAKVVDPEWLYGQGRYAGVYNPNARALREAAARVNEVWRVLHRVTYVSRVPLQFESAPLESAPLPERRPVNLVGNRALIREVAQYIVDHQPQLGVNASRPGPAAIGVAIDELMDKTLKARHPWWEALWKLYDAQSRNGGKPRDAYELVVGLRRDMRDYVPAAYTARGVQPSRPLGPVPLLFGDGEAEEEERPARVSDGLLALYAFEERGGHTVRDCSGHDEPIDLAIPAAALDQRAVSWDAGRLTIHSPTTLLPAVPNGDAGLEREAGGQGAAVTSPSAGGATLTATVAAPATRLTRAIKASGALTVEAWVRPQPGGADGMRRIVSLASGPAARNLGMAHYGPMLHARLRTSAEQPGGGDQPFAAPLGMGSGVRHLVFTRQSLSGGAGMARLYVDGREVASRRIDGPFDAWDETANLALAGEVGGLPGQGFLGELHLVAIYERALSGIEVRQNYSAGAQALIPPLVEAGPDQILDLERSPGAVVSVQLRGSVIDDRQLQAALQPQWSLVSGPAEPDFGPGGATSWTPTVSFSRAGVYVLALEVTDDQGRTGSDRVKVEVLANQRPVVTVIAPAQVPIATPTLIEGVVVEDGAPARRGRLQLEWTAIKGPASPLIAALSQDSTAVSFPTPGRYQLSFRASDGHLSGERAFEIAAKAAPQVGVEAAPGVSLFEGARLIGTVLDDGQGEGGDPLSYRWERTQGPADVELSDPHGPQTMASFTQPGVYTLRFIVSNGLIEGSASVTFKVEPRVQRGLISLYTFDERDGKLIQDRSGTGEPLNLQIENLANVSRAARGLEIREATSLRSTEAAGPSKVVKALKASGALTVELWLKHKSLSTQRTGIPGHILTISKTSTERDFTLQQGEYNERTGSAFYMARLRTTATDNNADPIDPANSNKRLRPLATAPGSIVTTEQPVHIVYTRDGTGESRIYLDGKEVIRGQIAGDLSSWDEKYPLMLGNDLTNERPWLGTFYVLAIYDRALSQEEISANKEAGWSQPIL